MKALVTGAGGLCGKHLTNYLKELGVEVHTLSQRDYMTPLHHQIPDITDINAVTSVLKSIRPDYVFHLAGITYSDSPVLFYRLNSQFAVALLYALKEAALDNCPILLVGTSAEYGNISHNQLPIHEDIPPRPYNHYGISKLAQTFEGIAAHKKGLPVVIVRPFNVIGIGMHENLVVQSLATQIIKIMKGQLEPVIKVGNLESTRDFIDVKDVIKIYWDIINLPSAYGEIINICSGKGTSIRAILSKLIKLSGVSVAIESDFSRFKAVDISEHYGCTKKLKRITGYVPDTNLDITLGLILEWLGNKL